MRTTWDNTIMGILIITLGVLMTGTVAFMVARKKVVTDKPSGRVVQINVQQTGIKQVVLVRTKRNGGV